MGGKKWFPLLKSFTKYISIFSILKIATFTWNIGKDGEGGAKIWVRAKENKKKLAPDLIQLMCTSH